MDRARETSGQTVLCAGNEKVHESGLLIMMSKRSEKVLLEWTPVSKRIITTRFYCRSRRLTSMIQVCVPHNEREKDHFYEELQRIDGYNRNDIVVVVMGDFNARVEGESETWDAR